MDNAKKKFSFLERINRFKKGFEGIFNLIYYEPNVWFDFAAAVVVIIAGIEFKISGFEWIMVTFAIGFVLTATAFGLAIDYMSEVIPENQYSDLIRNLAAASILITYLTAIVVGLIIFIPKIFFAPAA